MMDHDHTHGNLTVVLGATRTPSGRVAISAGLTSNFTDGVQVDLN